MGRGTVGSRSVYLGTFLIAFTTLGLEICLTRLLSVITWYHLAFFAISTAMLGMTAGAVTVYLKPAWFPDGRPTDSIATACLAYALATPLALVLLCFLPLTLTGTVSAVLGMALATALCSLPFYFSGIAIAAALTRCRLPIGRLYASDLFGAALGCLAVLAGVEVLDVPSLILLFGAVGVLAAWSFAWRSETFAHRRSAGWLLALLVPLSLVNASGSAGVAPVVVKGKVQDRSDYLFEKWNSFSRVVVHAGGLSIPQLWGPSPAMPPQRPVVQYWMDVDGDAGTTIRRFASLGDIRHLAYDVTNVAYHLRPEGGACIVGAGGGRDVHSALLFGQERVLGIEVNPIFVELLRGQFREFAALADDPRVRLVVDEARSHLTNHDESFRVIQMSLIDTWAATGAGAFSLSENALYTVDAWRLFLRRLDDDGIFTVSRWYSPENLGEAGRVCSLAVAALLDSGAAEPGRHLAMLTAGKVSTTLVSRRPFSSADTAKLRQVASKLRFGLVIAPDEAPANELLRRIVAVRSREELRRAIADAPFNYEPPTDDSPYFFNMLRPSRLGEAFASAPGVARGNLIATITLTVLLGCLMVLAAVTIVVPLWLGRRVRSRATSRAVWAGVGYFSLIGFGFMLVEIALIQRLSVFLSHPVYALSVLLFTVIAGTGCGSFLSERLPLTRSPWCYALPIAMAGAIAGQTHLLPACLSTLVAAPMAVKMAAAVVLIFPLGLLLGFFFPCGMRLVRSGPEDDTPWYWALNGIFGVLGSAVAVLVSIYEGISTNFLLAALCYAALVVCVPGMRRDRARREAERGDPRRGDKATVESVAV